MKRILEKTFSHQKNILFSVMILLVLLAIPARQISAQEKSLTKYVNPFIGTAPGNDKFGFTGNTGDVFPGADYPRGMIQWSPDTPSPLPGGYYYPDSAIKGFSLRHFSGRGCASLQDFAFMPIAGKITAPPSEENKFYAASISHKNETASPGYYSVLIDNGLKVELTVTKRSGIGRFTFPKTKDATILVNTGSNARGNTENTSVTVVGNNELQGYATARVGCGKVLYTIYFAAKFDRPFTSFGTWNDKKMNDGTRESKGANTGAYLTFDASGKSTIEAKVGISFVSIKNAEANLNAENPGWNFNSVKTAANSAWNKALSRITVEGGTESEKTIFYTALYHTYFHPNIFNDVNGEYIGMDGKVHKAKKGHTQYENIPGWDIYRSATALTALLTPDESSDIMQSLVNYAEQGGGGLPRWQQENRNSGGMVGDGPVIMISNAYAFGARGFDLKAALKAMDLNAGKIGTMSDSALVRSNLSDYLKLGYTPNQGSHTLEYATADFALSQFAKALGDNEKYKLYLDHSANWKNLYNSATGYIQPRDKDGAWMANVAPNTKEGWTEGSTAQYTWSVPFNIRGLFDKMGGDEAALARLDKYFTKLNEGSQSEYSFMGNEPCEGHPWAYHFAGAPYKTQEVISRIHKELFTDAPNGFPGNDDAGSISSWYVFSSLGLFPAIPGTDVLMLSTPKFSKAVIHLPGGKLTIIGTGAGEKSPYIQGLKLNGKDWNKSWLRFSDIKKGATLTYTLGSEANKNWGSDKSSVPPSFGE